MRKIFPGDCASANEQGAESIAQRVRTVIFIFMYSSPSRSTRHSTLGTRPFSLDQPARPREHLRWYRQADLLGCREIHYELVARPTGSATGLVTFWSLISVVALFVGCATMAVFLSRLLIWDCST